MQSYLAAVTARATDAKSAPAAEAAAVAAPPPMQVEPPPPAHTLVDAHRMAAAMGSEAMVTRILNSFVTRADATMTKLRTAFANDDITTLRREAHSLKGACGYIASDRLMASAKALQFGCDAIMKGESAEAPLGEMLASVEADMGWVLGAIQDVLAARQ